MAGMAVPSVEDEGKAVNDKVIVRKLNQHILLKFIFMTILCYIDRTNLAFAALQLNKSLGFSEQIYGTGSSIFFLGYSALQIPSNLMLVRFGAPVWLSIIIVTWGIVATSFATLQSVPQFYLFRLLLGVSEAGTFPGMWYHMSQFYSDREMGVAYSWINAGTALSQVFGAPLAAALLSLDGLLGLRGWQWLFIVEGLPTVFLGLWINRSLAESPLKADFLKPQEAQWLHQRQTRNKGGKGMPAGAEPGAWYAVCCWKTWYLAFVAMLENVVKSSIIYWGPLIVASMVGHEHALPKGRALLSGGSGEAEGGVARLSIAVKGLAAAPLASRVVELNQQAASDYSGALVALLTALPFGLAAIVMLVMAKNSAATGERKLHVALPFMVSAGALGLMSWTIDSDPLLAFIALLGGTVLWGPSGILAALPATFLSGPAAATGVAFINSIANIGGALGPFMIGALKQRTQSYQQPIAILSAVTAATCVLVSFFPMERFAPEGKKSATGTPGRAMTKQGGSRV